MTRTMKVTRIMTGTVKSSGPIMMRLKVFLKAMFLMKAPHTLTSSIRR
jgi:hypothetical protein